MKSYLFLICFSSNNIFVIYFSICLLQQYNINKYVIYDIKIF